MRGDLIMIKPKQVQNVHIKNKIDPAASQMSASDKCKVWRRIGKTAVKNAPRMTWQGFKWVLRHPLKAGINAFDFIIAFTPWWPFWPF